MANTPNLNLNLPASGSFGWDTLLNQNFSLLDSYLSNGLNVPNLGLAGKLLTYNGVVTVGMGVPAIIAANFLSGQTIAISNTLNTAVAGVYRVSGYIHMQVAGTGGTIQLFVGWNDGSATQSQNTPAISASSLAAYTPFTFTFRSAASQNITYNTQFSGVTGSPQYQLDILLERLA